MDELHRYIEYLQKSRSSDVWQAAHDTQKYREWITTNRQRLEQIAFDVGSTSEAVDDFEKQLAAFAPSSQFDSFTARAIFQPILAEVLAAARESSLAPTRNIVFCNDTDVSPSASVIPSSSEHLLFAGVGTYAFCNYWAKAISGITTSYAKQFLTPSFTAERLQELWQRESEPLITAAKLAVYCRMFGSAVGFGVMPGRRSEAAFRLELLHAMETFAIAHEVGHCYFEEKHPGKPNAPADEYACDLYALPISRAVGNRRQSWSAFCGAGAYVFLRAAATSLGEELGRHAVTSHPYARERAKRLVEITMTYIDRDQADAVENYLRDFRVVFDNLDQGVERALQVIRPG